MDHKKIKLLDDHMIVLDQLEKIHIDEFFYTRLKSRMETEKNNSQFELPIRPIYILSCLGLMIILNIIFLGGSIISRNENKIDSDIHQIISMYDQNINSLY